MSNPNRQVFEYRGPRIAERYNQFFNPNVCHVCKSTTTDNLISCDQCGLISYCSVEHKTLHYTEHAEICSIIKRILGVRPEKDARRFSDWQRWIQSRKELVILTQQNIGRPLKTYEKQVILWSKTCAVCHQQAELNICRRCFSVNCCNEHTNAFRTKYHGAICDRLTLSINIDIETISGNTSNISYRFLPFVDGTSQSEEMLEFCMEFILARRRNLNWLTKDYVQSDYLSGPLTVYSGCNRLNILDVIWQSLVVIHIIAANSADRNSLPAWELLLHLVPSMRKLVILMIGPELEYNCSQPTVCELCTAAGKKVVFFSIPILYHDYIDSSAEYKIPTMIVGFHAELNKGIAWSKSIRAIQARKRPLLLGCSCIQEARDDIIKIKTTLGTDAEPILMRRNHFSGLVPHRDLETGDTYFRNEYIIIYDDLEADICNAYV